MLRYKATIEPMLRTACSRAVDRQLQSSHARETDLILPRFSLHEGWQGVGGGFLPYQLRQPADRLGPDIKSPSARELFAYLSAC